MRLLVLCLTFCALVATPAHADLLSVWGTGGAVGPHVEGIAVDGSGTVLVADLKSSRVRRFSPAGVPAGSFVSGAGPPRAVVVAADGSVLVGGPAGVFRHAADGSPVGLFAEGQLGVPGGLAVDRDGRLLVTDAADGRLLRVTPGGGVTVLRRGLQDPTGVAAAPDGSLYFAERDADRVVHLSESGQELGRRQVIDPHGIAVTPSGAVHVASAATHRVVALDAALALTGSQAGVNRPRALAADCRGGVWVVDNSSVRVLRFGAAGTPAPPCPAPVLAPPAVTPKPPGEVAVLGVQAQSLRPALGVSAVAQRVSGKVLAGGKVLVGPSLIGIGTEIDATAGRVRLTFATHPSDFAARGRTQTGEFYGGSFTIHQAKSDTLVELRLTGATTGCSAKARTSAKKRARLWGSAKGKFRTTGRHGTAAVRGTVWLTEESCSGTRVRVREGVVRVRENDSGKSVDVKAGEEFTARPACLSKRVFDINVQVPVGTRLSTVEVRLAGRRIPVRLDRRTGRPTARIDLRGRPKGQVTVRITVVTRSGERLRGTRTYRTCSETQPGGNPPL